MGDRWQADMARPKMGGAVGNGTLYARDPAFYLAGFDPYPAIRAWGRTGDSALLGDRRSRSHIRFEDGGEGAIGLQKRRPIVRVDVRCGAISTELGCPGHVWFTPGSDRSAEIPERHRAASAHPQ